MGKRLDIKVGYLCNNKCFFCAQGDKRREVASRSLAEISREMEDSREQGADGVVFTGGEATLHPDLSESVMAARRLGYKSIQLQSNGRLLAYPETCRKMIEAGVTEFGLALHGSRPEIHEGLTQSPGSWSQTAGAIRNLRKLGAYVHTNTVVTSRNYTDLPDLAKLLVRLGVDQFQFAFVHIVGTALENKDWLVPRVSEVMPFVRQGLDVGLSAGLTCHTEAIPYCLMEGYEDCVAERIIPQTTVVDSVRVDDFTEWRKTEGKAKGPRCAECRHDKTCEGPWKEYPELFGWEEFRPVPIS